jgi:hypothetical protein
MLFNDVSGMIFRASEPNWPVSSDFSLLPAHLPSRSFSVSLTRRREKRKKKDGKKKRKKKSHSVKDVGISTTLDPCDNSVQKIRSGKTTGLRPFGLPSIAQSITEESS